MRLPTWPRRITIWPHASIPGRPSCCREGGSARRFSLAFADLRDKVREHVKQLREKLFRPVTTHDKDKKNMKSFLIANPKGGSGKSTLAINLAGHLACSGHHVMLGDVDRQQSSREWLRMRPRALPEISCWDIEPGKTARPPKGTTHVVLDTPAALHGKALDNVVKQVSRVLIPVQPSLFDMLATRHGAFSGQIRAAGADASAHYSALRTDGDARHDDLRHFRVACGQGPRAVAADHRLDQPGLTVMTCRDTPDDESHDRPPLPLTLLPRGEKHLSFIVSRRVAGPATGSIAYV
jgi:DNA polymerase III delta prime subunit